ncbi:MAG: hypothetical protein P1U74_08665 [Legionellaceae bacterium]|nr:hypothetical protein [Legionellaceae bacterium]
MAVYGVKIRGKYYLEEGDMISATELNIKGATEISRVNCQDYDLIYVKKVNKYLFDYLVLEIDKIHSQLPRYSIIVHRLINDLIFINHQEIDTEFGNTKYLLAFYSLYKAMNDEEKLNTIKSSYLGLKGKSLLFPLYRELYLNFIQMVPKLRKLKSEDYLHDYENTIKYSDVGLIQQQWQIKGVKSNIRSVEMSSSSTQTSDLNNGQLTIENRVLIFLNYLTECLQYVFLPFFEAGMYISFFISGFIAMPGICLDYYLRHKNSDIYHRYIGGTHTLKSMRLLCYLFGISDSFSRDRYIVNVGGFFSKYPFGILGEFVGDCVGISIMILGAIVVASMALFLRIIPLAILLAYKIVSSVLVCLFKFGNDLICTSEQSPETSIGIP